MKIKKYIKTLLEGSGHLNAMPFRRTNNSPHYGGYVKIQGKIYRITAWDKSNADKKTFSLKVVESDEEGNYTY